jgi:hypothetical protein
MATKNPAFAGLFRWARLGSNQRLLACEASDQDTIILVIRTICILGRFCAYPLPGPGLVNGSLFPDSSTAESTEA